MRRFFEVGRGLQSGAPEDVEREGRMAQRLAHLDPPREGVASASCRNQASSTAAGEEPRRVVTTLCGSTRFAEAFNLVNMHLSLMGRVVFSLPMFGHADAPAGAKFLCSDGDEATAAKQQLDALHRCKIAQSDGIFVINVGGYVGSSTRREIAYAQSLGKTVEWLFPPEVSAAAGEDAVGLTNCHQSKCGDELC